MSRDDPAMVALLIAARLVLLGAAIWLLVDGLELRRATRGREGNDRLAWAGVVLAVFLAATVLTRP